MTKTPESEYFNKLVMDISEDAKMQIKILKSMKPIIIRLKEIVEKPEYEYLKPRLMVWSKRCDVYLYTNSFKSIESFLEEIEDIIPCTDTSDTPSGRSYFFRYNDVTIEVEVSLIEGEGCRRVLDNVETIEVKKYKYVCD